MDPSFVETFNRLALKPAPFELQAVTIEGFKSLANESRLEIQPLTVLAGANSSGKSSAIQPLLLLKQTLDSPTDPGPLKLKGPNALFTRFDQTLSKFPHKKEEFSIGIEFVEKMAFKVEFETGTSKNQVLHLKANEFSFENHKARLCDNITEKEILNLGQYYSTDKFVENIAKDFSTRDLLPLKQEYFFFHFPGNYFLFRAMPYSISNYLSNFLHLPGLRGNSERFYSRAPGFQKYSGTFEGYVAEILYEWKTKTPELLQKLGEHMSLLGLTHIVEPVALDDTSIEIRVGFPIPHHRNGRKELVNIFDVGLGVSQVLPVLVGLLTAKKDQLIYIDQPELHLHPRAQVKLAEILAEAANRGVKVIIETHSALLLLAIQTLAAKGELSPEKVALHWFKRNPKTLVTDVISGNLDSQGRFGDWPEDFGVVEVAAQNDFLEHSLWPKTQSTL